LESDENSPRQFNTPNLKLPRKHTAKEDDSQKELSVNNRLKFLTSKKNPAKNLELPKKSLNFKQRMAQSKSKLKGTLGI
jgi:hypothetical protein